MPCTGGILAVIFGFVARSQIKRSNGTQRGSGMALAGIILGFVWLAASVTVGGLAAGGVFDSVGVDVPTRAAFVTKFSRVIENEPSTQFDLLPADLQDDARKIFRDFAGCVYDELEAEPRYLENVYENPTGEDEFIPLTDQDDVDQIDENIRNICEKQLNDAVAELVGG